MRCRACNKQLNDIESTKKDNKTGEFIDMCSGCYSHVLSELYYSDKEVLNIEGDCGLTDIINRDTLTI